MLNPYFFEETLRLEQILLDQRNARQAVWLEALPRRAPGSLLGGSRRWVARALLMLADRLDPRAVVPQLPHVPGTPSLNGTLHHA
jgi:hypothetical protein